MDKSAPRIDEECPNPIDDAWRADVRRALNERHHVECDVDAKTGAAAAAVVAVVGPERRAHEMLVFVRDAKNAVAHAVDYLDGLVADVAKRGGPEAGRFLPLDWEGRPYGGGFVFVRGEVRDYSAEEGAATLLGEDPPPRALGRPASLST